MNEHDNEEDVIRTVRNALDAGLDQLDPSIAQRLQAGRRRALDLADKKPFRLFGMPRLVPAGAFATLAITAVAVSLWFSLRPPTFPHKALDEIEILAVQGNLEMYRDLEFFQLLAQTHEAR